MEATKDERVEGLKELREISDYRQWLIDLRVTVELERRVNLKNKEDFVRQLD